jgi:hypothetical protein
VGAALAFVVIESNEKHQMTKNTVTLLGVGDVGPIHEPMEAYSMLVRPTLAAADIRFAHCERLYSRRGALQVHFGVKDQPGVATGAQL